MNILYLNEHNPIFQSKPSSDDVKGDFDIEGIIQHPNKDCDISWSSLKNLGCIGRGTFASVHMVQDKANDHRTYALKAVNRIRTKNMHQRRRLGLGTWNSIVKFNQSWFHLSVLWCQ
mmetsp:Transcript_39651/g.51125  ORF Transcript_39651/g.51125 Transcript_39651/m.51125 type:complete len:117 (+) Transcript_39651:70-420(+)